MKLIMIPFQLILDDELMEEGRTNTFPLVVPLMNSKEKMKCRKVRSVLRFPPQNKHYQPEKYAHHLLMCYYPFRSEDELKLGTYTEKLLQPGVIEKVNENKMIVEPYGDLVDEALENFLIDTATHNLDAFAQQENDEVEDDINTSVMPDENDSDEEHTETSYSTVSTQRFVVTDDELFSSIRSLNAVQRNIFDAVYHWGKTLVKLRNSIEVNEISPLYIFLTGGGGCGKSHLLITLYKALTKALLHKGGEPDKARVLRIAPTGVAAIN